MPTIDQAFIKQFEREVHEAFQRQGSKLRNTVRTINDVKGASHDVSKSRKRNCSNESTARNCSCYEFRSYEC